MRGNREKGEPGILYIVPTPVGNLEDMTFRAVQVLKEADLILAEDTRTSSVLLKHYDIHGHLESHHKFNEHRTAEIIKERILAGANVLMPNLTLSEVREEYQIYQNKPGIGEDAAISSSKTEQRLSEMKIPIGWGQWGDSKHYSKR